MIAIRDTTVEAIEKILKSPGLETKKVAIKAQINPITKNPIQNIATNSVSISESIPSKESVNNIPTKITHVAIT